MDDVDGFFDRLEQRIKEAIPHAIDAGLTTLMQDVLYETESGRSPVTRTDFASYSTFYEDYKESKLGLPSSPVNLRVSGSIEEYDIELDAESSSGTLYFTGNTYTGARTGEVMAMHQFGRNRVPVRKIFPESVNELQQDVVDEIRNELLNRINNA